MTILFAVIACGLLSVVYAIWATKSVMAADQGNARMQEIAGYIREGAQAYLNRQYTTIAIVGAVVFVITWLLLGATAAIGFLIGAVLSGAAGYVGMHVSVRANVRTAQASAVNLAGGLDIAFKAGAITGMLVAGLALLGVAVYYYILTGPMALASDSRQVIDALVALGFGASLISIFARLGGGIFTKGADVGGDLVGKVEAGIPEDDPRNPATIADNVGDNVGDCAGMAADLFETYAVTVVATMVLGAIFFGGMDILGSAMLYPLAICGASIITSIIGTFFVKLGTNGSIMGALYKGLIVTGVLSIIGLGGATSLTIGWGEIAVIDGKSITGTNLFLCGAGRSGRHRADRGHHRVLHRHQQASGQLDQPGVGHRSRHQRDPGSRHFAGIDRSAGDRHRWRHHLDLPACGLFGTGIAVTAMLGIAGMIVALDAFGPVTDNAGGIAEMSGLPPEVRQSTDALDAVGNTTKAVTKGYAIGSAGLGALVLFAAYSNDLQFFARQANAEGSTLYPYFKDMGEISFDLSNPYVVAGLIFGGLIPYLFGGIAMTAVGRAAGSIVEEVRSQFKAKPGHHGWHREARLRPCGGYPDQGCNPRNDRAVAAAGPCSAVRLFRRAADLGLQGIRVCGTRCIASGRDCQRPLRRHLDDLGRWRMGQRQEVL
jgi:K(+)-stimulated pyrophosphate-energized sodium pump